ncbi:hypothetical protein K9F62_00380 [Desulfovibrio sp. JY]|nr:hypothetical protein K9F62_00380 [Desulfovibrio sp. JY]
MTTTCSIAITFEMFIFSLLMLCLASPACSQPFPETYTRPGTVVHEQAGGHFVRVGTQHRYYVDSMGRRHRIVREVIEPSAPLGMLYYIENDDHQYYVDEGHRLYTRDTSGRVYYLEEVGQRGNVQSRTTMRENRPYMAVQPMMQRESCASQYGKCMAGCQGISRREAYTKPVCINNCEIIKNGCRGQ